VLNQLKITVVVSMARSPLFLYVIRALYRSSTQDTRVIKALLSWLGGFRSHMTVSRFEDTTFSSVIIVLAVRPPSGVLRSGTFFQGGYRNIYFTRPMDVSWTPFPPLLNPVQAPRPKSAIGAFPLNDRKFTFEFRYVGPPDVMIGRLS